MSIGEFSKAINSTDVGKFLFGGWTGMASHINSNKWHTSLKGALHAGFGTDDAGEMLSFELGGQKWSGKKIAGGLAGLGIGYRFASGGGAYRDKNGDTDIAGIPFI